MKNRLDYLTNLIDKYFVGVACAEGQKEVQLAILELEQRVHLIETALAVDVNELEQRVHLIETALAVDVLPSCYDDSSYNDALDLNRKMQIQVQKLIDARDNQMLQEG